MQNVHVQGWVEAGFEEVEKEFVRNFTTRNETGAACAVYVRGMKVVDLWGGVADPYRRTPWEEHTMVPVFSSTKGFAALAGALAVSRGLLNYDEKVCTYWPEFAVHGKEDISVRQLLSHQAGLCTLDTLQLEKFDDLDTAQVAPKLAQLKPKWTPGTMHGYHAWTLGWYIGELIRRADSRGRSLGRFFQEEIANPLGAEFYIGLPKDVPDTRLAQVRGINSPVQLLKHLRGIPFSMLLAFMNPRSLTARSMVDPKRLVANDHFNRREMLAIEFPSGNGIGEVRAMACIYGEFAAGGKQLKLSEAAKQALEAPPKLPSTGAYDHVNRTKLAYSVGLWKPIEGHKFGSSHRAYGHPGAGGSFCYADPDYELGYAYGLNVIGGYMDNNPRENAVRQAVYRCLK
ncbi:serine hydrolase domain-containing protein [Paenibacillus alvei]|uniref:serine hydrolase domain-containing protein n=1 Tax=Paenibacillus alvei TaxID=44250 RepID=UPI0018CDFAF4|nr:serine hydrolase domain-containing protein [Paenibacillus alvei]MCY9578421.1 beta-lactamase family protein [Paenibacillus alvei]MCY9584742.1 beta-lactamase family protein [Paenibacillus alvei]